MSFQTNDIVLALYSRSQAVDYHWAVLIMTDSDHAIRYHLKGSTQERTWRLVDPDKVHIMRSLRGLMYFRMGKSNDINRTIRRICDPALVIQGSRSFTCRTWTLAVIQKLHEIGDVVLKETVAQLESEATLAADHRRVCRNGDGPDARWALSTRHPPWN